MTLYGIGISTEDHIHYSIINGMQLPLHPTHRPLRIKDSLA